MSSNSTNRGYILQTSGENPGTWGLTPGLNGNWQTADTNLGGVATIALSSSNVTLSSTQYANGTIRLSGTLTASVNVFFPAVQGWWTIENLTTGNFMAIINITGSPGQQIGVEQGSAADIFLDGTNVKFRNLPPVGAYLDVVDSTVPAWISFCTVPPYLLCDGSTFSAVTYPYLNTKLGGTTLPDFRGRARFYLNGGTGRITTAVSGVNGDVRLSSGGEQTLQSHSHANTFNDPGHSHTTAINFYSSVQGGTGAGGVAVIPPSGTGSTTLSSNTVTTGASITNVNAGSGTSQNMPPACIGGLTLIRAA